MALRTTAMRKLQHQNLFASQAGMVFSEGRETVGMRAAH